MFMANATTMANVARLMCAMRYRNTRKIDKPNKPHSDITRSHPPSNAGPQFPGPTPTNQARGELVHVLIATVQRARRMIQLQSVYSSVVYSSDQPSNFSSGTLALEY